MKAISLRICRGCGCTDDHACPGGCSWVLLDFAIVDGKIVPLPSGFCSECAVEQDWDPDWLHFLTAPEAKARAKELGMPI
jgi:hypothetical protein